MSSRNGPTRFALGIATACVLMLSSAGSPVAGQATTFGVAYTMDAYAVVRGGVEQRGTLLHNLDLTAAADGSRVGLPGFEGFLYLLANRGGSLSAAAGDWQTASNIEAPSALRLYELWVQKTWRESLSLRVGLYDLNSEFYASDAGTLFINSGHGVGPEFGTSGVAGPSIFPVTSLTARLQRVTDRGYARVAVLDGVPGHHQDEMRFVHIGLNADEGALVIGEVASTAQASAKKVALGAWTYTASFPDALEGEPGRNGTFGMYLLAETALAGDVESGRSLVAFSRVGYADAGVHAVSWSWGGGLVKSGVLGAEKGDQLGVAVTSAVHSNRYLRTLRSAGTSVDRGELAFELTWSMPLKSWLRVQPDVQYILNPGMTPSLRNALLLGTRVEIAF